MQAKSSAVNKKTPAPSGWEADEVMQPHPALSDPCARWAIRRASSIGAIPASLSGTDQGGKFLSRVGVPDYKLQPKTGTAPTLTGVWPSRLQPVVERPGIRFRHATSRITT
jgi:hypothetical protein